MLTFALIPLTNVKPAANHIVHGIEDRSRTGRLKGQEAGDGDGDAFGHRSRCWSGTGVTVVDAVGARLAMKSESVTVLG
jgi:hypothetical protein